MLPLWRRQLTCDVVIVGAGFGGSLMAMVAHQLGFSVVLLERGRHPRMAIGESTTPLSNLLLEKLCASYDLPRIAPLAKWGSWQRTYPDIACGLKRGFSFFHGEEALLVAASPRDEIGDTHWYRADVDHFLLREAQRLGVDCREGVRILSVNGSSVLCEGFTVDAGLLIDATGPRGFLHRALQLEEAPLPGMPATEGLYSHFTGVGRGDGETFPYPAEDAAVHHVFDGGWVWVLRFNNGVTSAGVAATRAVAEELGLREGAPAWRRVLERLPALAAHFEHAVACEPFRHMPCRLAFAVAGWLAMGGRCYRPRRVLWIRCCRLALPLICWELSGWRRYFSKRARSRFMPTKQMRTCWLRVGSSARCIRIWQISLPLLLCRWCTSPQSASRRPRTG